MANEKAKYEFLAVESLELDIKNPRIAQWVEMYGEQVNEEAMELALMRGGPDDTAAATSYSGLKQSIITNGGVIHPIIVNRQSNGKLVVIEGNTRVIIYRDCQRNQKKSQIRGDWSTIPALVYDNMSEEEIDAIRLQAHLVGAREWDPYSKAKYLNTLRSQLNLPFAQIVDFCGGNQREVEKLIGAYNDMEAYYREVIEDDQEFDPTRFSGFVELQNPRILESLISHGFSKSDFAKWIRDRRLHPLSMVRQLPRILQEERSKQAFLKEGAQEAVKLLDTSEPSATPIENASLELLAKEVYKRINSIEYAEILRLRAETGTEEKYVIRAAIDALNSFWDDITSEQD